MYSAFRSCLVFLKIFSRYFDIVEACLRCDFFPWNIQELCDCRYFYFDDQDIGHCTCGVAFETMMSILREHRLDHFRDPGWYTAVRRSSENPLVQRYLAEHICLSSIAHRGLLAVSAELGPLSHSSFHQQPILARLLSTDNTRHLYVSTAHNSRPVDGVVLVVDRHAKQAHVYPIQITLTMRHKKPDEDFYTTTWQEWVAPLEGLGFTVKSTFIWVDRKRPARLRPTLVKEFRSGTKIVRPEYRTIHIGIEQVNGLLDEDYCNL
jgi:hypothetical protein